MPDSRPYQKKQIFKVWLLNFIVPGFGMGTLYACGTGALGILFWFWVLELFFMRLDVVLFVSVAMSVWGTIEVVRQNQAIEFEEELDAARMLPGTMAAVDNLIDNVSKGLVFAIEDDRTVYALDTLEKKAREAELRLKSIEEKLHAQAKDQTDDITGITLDKLPETLGGEPSSFEKPPETGVGTAASGLMSFAPLFETVEDQHGLSLPVGKEPEPLPAARSSQRSGEKPTLSFAPHDSGDHNENEDAIRVWLDTSGGASHACTVPGTTDLEESSAELQEAVEQDAASSINLLEPDVAPVAAPPAPIFVVGASEFESPESALETQGLNDQTSLEPSGFSEQAQPEAALEPTTSSTAESEVATETSEPGEYWEPSGTPKAGETALKAPTHDDLMKPLESQEITEAGQAFVLESSVPDNVMPNVSFESSFNSNLDEVSSNLSVAGLDTPFEASAMSTVPTSSATFASSLESNSSTGFTDFLTEKDRKVTDFVDKLANTIGGATAPQPTVDSPFEFSLPDFESSFSFDFSNALADVAEKDTANTASKSSKHCQRCGSDRQSDFSFCLKCGISFSA